jgi:hypothetical protein
VPRRRDPCEDLAGSMRFVTDRLYVIRRALSGLHSTMTQIATTNRPAYVRDRIIPCRPRSFRSLPFLVSSFTHTFTK